MRYTQENRLIAIDTPLGKDVLLLQGFTGREAISRLFSFHLDLASEKDSISFKSIIGQNVTIRVSLVNNSLRYFNGFVSRFAQSGSDERFTNYQMEVVPWLWFLTRITDCRIFQEKKIPDIIEEVFKSRGFKDYKLSLTGSYDPREYCVQYRETDFNFVSRLMEQYGIFYFFEHQNGKHTMVLADSESVHQPCPRQATVHYNLNASQLYVEDVITSWQMEQELRTGKYALADYNFETPNANLLVDEPTVVNVGGNDDFEIYDYPGEYLNRSQGKTLAGVRMQEEEASHLVVSGSGGCRVFSSGYKFTLADHYRKDMNDSYLLTEVQHLASVSSSYTTGSGGDGDHYLNHFTCIPANVPFRPARVTPQPFVQGPQTALVVGKSGEEIWVDKFGRVKVQFYWDREGKKDEKSSCWIRVSQNWAGKGWGALYLPRIGQEVVVDFLEGDPDRPIITGRVYNGDNMPFYQLPDYQTLSYHKSNSSKGGKGFNEIRFEDKKDKEQVFIHSQKRMDVRVKGSYYDTCHGNRETVVGWEGKEDTGGDYNLLVEGNNSVHIKKGFYGNIDEKLNLTVKSDVVCDFESNQSTLVKTKSELNAQQIIIEASQKISMKVGGNFIMIDPSGVTIYGTMVKINSGGYGAETGDPDITDAQDAYASDTGEPGYLEKIAKSGGKGRGWHHRKLRSQHYIAPPRVGEDPRMTAIRNTLQFSATGRHALEVYDRYGITPTFNPGGTAYGSGVVNMDPSRTDPATSFVHEMNHAQNDKEGTSANINDPDRAHYIDQQLQEDAHGERLAFQTQRELADAGHPENYNSITGPSYQTGYRDGVAAEKARNPNATPEELDQAGNDAAERRVLDDYRNGRVTTGNTSPPQSYVNYWGQNWDNNHPPAAGGTGGGGH